MASSSISVKVLKLQSLKCRDFLTFPSQNPFTLRNYYFVVIGGDKLFLPINTAVKPGQNFWNSYLNTLKVNNRVDWRRPDFIVSLNY